MEPSSRPSLVRAVVAAALVAIATMTLPLWGALLIRESDWLPDVQGFLWAFEAWMATAALSGLIASAFVDGRVGLVAVSVGAAAGLGVFVVMGLWDNGIRSVNIGEVVGSFISSIAICGLPSIIGYAVGRAIATMVHAARTPLPPQS